MNHLQETIRETTSADSRALVKADRSLRVGILTNPLSGKNRRGHYVKTRKLLMDYPQVLNRDVQTPKQIDTALKDFADKDVGLIIISGGDGTVQATLTSLLRQGPLETLPLLAILAAGTTNMNAGDVGITGNPANALRELLVWANTPSRTAAVRKRAILRVQQVGGEGPLYGMFFGIVGIAQGTRFFHNHVNPMGLRGEFGPGLALLRLWYDWARGRNRYLHPEDVTIELDGQPAVQREILLIMVSTLERLMLGLRPFWGAGHGPLHYTQVDAKAVHMLRVLPALLRGRRHSRLTVENGYLSKNVNQLHVFTRGEFALDGEVYPTNGSEPIVLTDGGPISFLSI
jgi:hypothetical protein